MEQSAILLPLAAQVLYTFLLALNLLRARNGAVKSGEMSLSRFRANQGGDSPEHVAVAERAYQNALEVPPLFFAAGIAALAAQQVDELFLILAWAYVGLRVLQSLIHLTYNNVMHRFMVFELGWVVLLILWGKLAFAVL